MSAPPDAPEPRVRLVTVGEELLDGRVRDENTHRLARAVVSRGGRVPEARIVPDDDAAVRDAVEEALAAADGVVVSGGLGPSRDDRTREGIAAAVGRALEDAGESGGERTGGTGSSRRPDERPGRQRRLPEGARPLPNPTGTALAFACVTGRGWILAVPGVPAEVRGLLDGEAGRFLDDELPGEARPSRRVGLAGRPESEVVEELETIGELAGVEVATYPRTGLVDVHLRPVAGRPRGKGDAALERAVEALRRRFGEDVYATGDRELAEVVLDDLRAARETVATAESCTGGLLGGELTAVPGASDVFWGGVVAYADAAKEATLGVSGDTLARQGAVSRATALEMAGGVRERAGTDWGVSVTGIAGPAGGTEEKPVGTVWLGVDGPHRSVVRYRFPGDRAEIRRRSVLGGLDLLRRLLRREG